MTHARKPRRNKRFHPSIPRLPMTGALRDRIATHMHGAFAALRLSPSAEAFDALANIVNMVGLTVQHDPAFLQQYLLINGAARTMNQIGAKVEAGIALRDHEIASLTVAVSAIDDILPRIDVARLFINEHIAVALVRAGQTQGAQPCPTTR
ncbi:hypothetical protein [Bordetella bronchiseptica]|uniref:Uncharacterized protein n=3 Tax=Bordetella bronchiseptica TaxID=518 RepID=A0ABR4RFH0_BORBO|nr:hypothetical protein [Bordetella bronchiseptica]KCV33709.1 hypothetical protein L490_2001 [Bordetella bronchiseptica 00-P-2796]SHS83436.1 Uncharacterised protein [Mycobacteroides abscessus subsp. abscessus]KDB91428.1 hypothetical protein AZ18_3699 [Bordetella bronchiseptica D993]KDC18999.1 hypothetical protein L542_3668 [Bordetella bronchiseptica F-1]KDD52324.1 hypothetical protein L534_3618 [Bordetella bronchiseptica RB630]